MNKHERKLHGKKRMKRRCNAMGIDPNSLLAKRAFLHQGKPCSCAMCSPKRQIGGVARWEELAPPINEPSEEITEAQYEELEERVGHYCDCMSSSNTSIPFKDGEIIWTTALPLHSN